MSKLNIMQSHEEFIKALRLAVPTYTLKELTDGLNMSKSSKNYADYIPIFEAEIAKRNNKK
jgi:hypothetical protein